MKTKLILLASLCLLAMTGCETAHDAGDFYKKQAWTPDSFNYTLERDRNTGDLADYFGLSWSLK